ncbi:MAG: lysophospholipid acyltransferase family protein [Desulfomonilia bacterium]
MVPTLIDELKKGRIIGIVIDQKGKRENRLFCDFFGMPAPTSPAPAFIALKGDALVIPVSAIKEGDIYRFRFEKPIDTRTFGDDFTNIESLRDCWKSKSVQELSNWMQSWVSSVVRQNPEQWLWLHSRWTRRSQMKRIIKKGLDFREFVITQERTYLTGDSPE